MQDHDPSNEEDLVWIAIIARGGREAEQALKALYRKYASMLTGFLVRRGANLHDAEDLLQETFIRVARGALTFRGEAKVSSWMHTVAKNLQVSSAQRKPPEDMLDDDQWQTVDAGPIGLREATLRSDGEAHSRASQNLQKCFAAAFARFRGENPDHAAALAIIVDEALSIRDLAARLQRTENATRTYLYECRKKFQRFAQVCRGLLSEM